MNTGLDCYCISPLVPPKDVTVQVHTLTVQEGLNVLLACSCKADPPVTEYRWSYTQHGLTVDLHQRTFTVRVYNVTRDMRVRCTAQNLIGRAGSKSTSLNIQCKNSIQSMFDRLFCFQFLRMDLAGAVCTVVHFTL